MTMESVISFYDCHLLAVHGAFPTCVASVWYFIWLRRAQRERPEPRPTPRLVVTPSSSCPRRPRSCSVSMFVRHTYMSLRAGLGLLKIPATVVLQDSRVSPTQSSLPKPSTGQHVQQQTHPFAPSTTTHGSGETRTTPPAQSCLWLSEHRVLHTVGTG